MAVNNQGNNDPLGIDYNKLSASAKEIENLGLGISTIQSDFKAINKEVENFNNLTNQLNKALQNSVKTVKDINADYLEYYKLQQKIAGAYDTIRSNNREISSISKQLNATEASAFSKIQEGLKARRDIGEELSKSEAAQNALNDAILKGNTSGQSFVDIQKEAIDSAEKLRIKEEKVAELAKIMEGRYAEVGLNASDINSELIRQIIQLSFANERHEDIVDNNKNYYRLLREQTTEYQKFLSKVDYYSNKIKDVIKDNKTLEFISNGILSTYDKIGISFSKILDNVLALDKTLTEFGKSVQVSKEGARTLADNFKETSYEASEINKNVSSTQASIKNQIEANNNLNKSLGTGALFTKQTRLDQIELVKGMGLEAEVGAKIYGLGKLNRLTAHQTAVAIGDQVVNTRKSTGITLDYRKVLTDVAKINGQLAVQYKNNPILLAEAVTQAQLLGLTLEQTSKMGSSLVDDFAGSLGRELEAELLTGKALNLEQARYFALMGDSAKAAKELMDNVGGIEEFQQLNVLQQKSLAAAVGLTTDELSNALTQQEFLKGTAFETKAAFEEAAREAARTGDYTKLNAELAQAANGEELAAQASQISNQEKFQMAVEKLQETIANMVNGPFGKLIDGFANLVSNATVLKGIMATISGIIVLDLVKGIFDLGKGLVKLIKPASTLAKLDTLSAAMKTFGIGVAIAGAAALAGYAAINAIASDGGGDGGSNPSISSTGGINVPNSGASGDRNININLKNENTTYVAGQKISHLNTEQQKLINTRRA